MTPEKSEKIHRLVQEKEELKTLIDWHQKKHFVFADIKIDRSHPLHSQLIAVFQNRLKYVESEIEKE